MNQETKEAIAGYFLSLKSVWASWLAGQNVGLPKKTESFFIGLTANYFQEFLSVTFKNQKGPLNSLGGGEIQGDEAWKIMRAYFNSRERTKKSILDTIFAQSWARARAVGAADADAALSEIVAFLLNRYRLHCRTAVRDFYAKEGFGTTGDRWNTESGDAPIYDADGTGSPLFETIPLRTLEISPEQDKEFMKIAYSASSAFFSTLTDVQKAGLYAIFARNNAGEKIRYNDPKISKFVNCGQSQFYDARREAIRTHIEAFRSTALWKEEDQIGQYRLEVLLEETLLDESFEWFSRKKS
jgi:hypothetical protein